MSRITPPHSTLAAAALLLLAVSLSSCVVTEFVGAYFNTYYNARKLFVEAEDEIWSAPETKSSGKNLLLTLNVSATVKQKLTSVIEKCSKLLQYHPDSKLVDDALSMVGKAYYYEADYPAAERKFKELIDTYPESGLVLEARVLQAYSQYKGGNVDGALALGSTVRDAAKESGDDDVEAYAAMLVGQIQQDRKNFTAARELYEEAGKKAANPDLRANAYLTSADMYYRSGDSSMALTAYLLAAGEARNYVHRFRAELGQARMRSKLGKSGEALDLLQRLRRNANYKEFWGEVDLEIGNNYQATEAFESAIDQYVYIDTAYARTEPAANADYQLGLIYEKHYGDYDSARVMYGKGRSASPQWAVAPLILERSDLLNKYQVARFAIRLNDSLRAAWYARKDTGSAGPGPRMGPDSASGIKDPLARSSGMSIADSPGIRQREVLDSSRASDRPTERTRMTQHVKDSLQAMLHPASNDSIMQAMMRAATKPVPIDTIKARLADAMNELAALWYTGFGNTDSAFFWYNRLLVENPATPHTPRALYTMAQMLAGRDSVSTRSRVDSLHRIIVERYPRSEFAVAARRLLRLPAAAIAVDSAETAYRRAERLLLSEKYAEAVDSMHSLSAAYPSSPYASRAEYAAGWMYEQKLNMPDSAISVYRRVAVRYPSSAFAALVKPKLDAVDQKNAAPPPQTAPASPGTQPGAAPAPGKPGSPVPPLLRNRASRRLLEDDSTGFTSQLPAHPDTSRILGPRRTPGTVDTAGSAVQAPPGQAPGTSLLPGQKGVPGSSEAGDTTHLAQPRDSTGRPGSPGLHAPVRPANSDTTAAPGTDGAPAGKDSVRLTPPRGRDALPDTSRTE